MEENSDFSFQITPLDAGRRLDLFVSSKIHDFSRSLVCKLILKGHIQVNKSIKKPGYLVKDGEQITGHKPLPIPINITPEPIPLNILYEDNHIIVINKQAGLVVHPAPGHYSGTLVNAILFQCSDIKGIGSELRPGIVHRLDKDTSGVIIVAKNDTALLKLAEQFKKRQVKKTYLAIVSGRVIENKGTIDLPIGRHPKDRKKMSVFSHKARKAETQWQVKNRFEHGTLLEIGLKTGRTHQIRVHCAAIHHPIIGDRLYGGRQKMRLQNCTYPVNRQMLHARQLKFIHPKNGRSCVINASIPDDMACLLEYLKASTPSPG